MHYFVFYVLLLTDTMDFMFVCNNVHFLCRYLHSQVEIERKIKGSAVTSGPFNNPIHNRGEGDVPGTYY